MSSTSASTSDLEVVGAVLPPRGVDVAWLSAGGDGVRCALRRGVVGRAVGLIGRASIGHGEALLLTRCNAIHTWFMRFPIDVVFIDRSMTVVEILEGVAPWRSPRRVRGARHAIELAAGGAARLGLEAGNRVRLEWSGG